MSANYDRLADGHDLACGVIGKIVDVGRPHFSHDIV